MAQALAGLSLRSSKIFHPSQQQRNKQTIILLVQFFASTFLQRDRCDVFLELLVLLEVAGGRAVSAGVSSADLAHKVGDGVATRAVVPGAIAHANNLVINDNGARFAGTHRKRASQ